MKIPKDLKYTKDHEWVKIIGNKAVVGITDFAQSELGDIIFVEFPEVDQEVYSGDAFGTIEAVKTVADIYSPVDGIILNVNEIVEDEPGFVNSDPYGKGWLVEIELENDPEGLLTASQYEELIKQ